MGRRATACGGLHRRVATAHADDAAALVRSPVCREDTRKTSVDASRMDARRWTQRERERCKDCKDRRKERERGVETVLACARCGGSGVCRRIKRHGPTDNAKSKKY